MAKIFITGSADGLGRLDAELLIRQGHQVVLHARNEERGEDAIRYVPRAETVLVGDLSIPEQTRQLAHDANNWGTFDAIIYNAGVYDAPAPTIFSVNSLAPYILTCMIQRPQRLVYLSSGLHAQGRADFLDYDSASTTYSTSKLHNVILTMAVARMWPEVHTNAVDPGWVPTKMGGAGAPGDLQKGFETQVWLAVSNEPEALVTGKYFHHQQVRNHRPEADDPDVQEAYLQLCAKESGVTMS